MKALPLAVARELRGEGGMKALPLAIARELGGKTTKEMRARREEGALAHYYYLNRIRRRQGTPVDLGVGSRTSSAVFGQRYYK